MPVYILILNNHFIYERTNIMTGKFKYSFATRELMNEITSVH